MARYSIGEWSDYVRNLLPTTQHREMEEHLAAGCEECRAAAKFLRELSGMADSDQCYDQATQKLAAAARQIFVPAVQAVQSEPVAQDADRVVGALRTFAAQLTFDSADGLHPSGARSERPAVRQLMYQAGDYFVDLRVDRERNTTRVIVVGQVANEKQPLLQLARLPVYVMAGKKIVSETASNEFGEFTLEFLPRPNLRLCVQVTQAGVQLEVPLKRSLEEHEA